MAVNKVVYDGETLIDLTGDTVDENTLIEGATAHDMSGKKIEGKAVVPTKLSQLQDDVGYAKKESPVFTGTPTAPTPSDDSDNDQIATTAFVKSVASGASVNVEANFLTSGGFGNLRYYQGKLEYFDTATETWVETSVTPDNVYIINMMPQAMRYMCGQYHVESGHYRLMFEEPADTVIDGQVACVVENVVIRRRLGEDPKNENDGTLVATITRHNFGMYKDDWYVDNAFSPNMGEEWHYKAFPIGTTGFANTEPDNSTGGILAKDYYLFEFQIDQNESDPDSMVSYASDNAKFKRAFMDYAIDKFNYGSWQDAFFMPKTCMLNTDGTVAYYLDPNDETLKEDGTPSDVQNPDFDGNAMVEFPKIWWKKSGDSGYAVASKQVDDGFKCWSNIDENGDEIEHFYMPMYDGCLINGRLRSLSGQTPMSGKTRQQELNYAHANNPDGIHMYETKVFCDVQLFLLLCILISGTTNSQKAFGAGNNNSYVSESNTGVKKTGTTNGKGMFWGNQDNKSCVRVFYMENPWGNVWKSCAGWINDHGTQKVKMTYGQSDGSTVDGYNTTGAGYVTITDSTPSGTSGGYISACKFDERGLIPKQASGSATTKYCDGLWFNNSQVNYALVGGRSGHGLLVGAFSSNLIPAASDASWYIGTSLSCKPLASIQGGES